MVYILFTVPGGSELKKRPVLWQCHWASHLGWEREPSNAPSTTLSTVSCSKDKFALNWRVICFPVSFPFASRIFADINIKIEMFALAAQPKMRFTDLWWERAHVLQCREAWPTNSFLLRFLFAVEGQGECSEREASNCFPLLAWGFHYFLRRSIAKVWP